MKPDNSAEPDTPPDEVSPDQHPPSRRRVLAGAGLFGAGAVAGGLGGYFGRGGGSSASGSTNTADAVIGDSNVTIPFYGTHQAGIATAAQDRLAFGSMNVVAGTSQSDLRDLLQDWTTAAARMTAGQPVGEDNQPYAPPVDTGSTISPPAAPAIR